MAVVRTRSNGTVAAAVTPTPRTAVPSRWRTNHAGQGPPSYRDVRAFEPPVPKFAYPPSYPGTAARIDSKMRS